MSAAGKPPALNWSATYCAIVGTLCRPITVGMLTICSNIACVAVRWAGVSCGPAAAAAAVETNAASAVAASRWRMIPSPGNELRHATRPRRLVKLGLAIVVYVATFPGAGVQPHRHELARFRVDELFVRCAPSGPGRLAIRPAIDGFERGRHHHQKAENNEHRVPDRAPE